MRCCVQYLDAGISIRRRELVCSAAVKMQSWSVIGQVRRGTLPVVIDRLPGLVSLSLLPDDRLPGLVSQLQATRGTLPVVMVSGLERSATVPSSV